MDVVAISKSEGVAILDDGSVVPFTNLFDAFGNETDCHDEGVAAIASLPDGTWAIIDFKDYESVSIH